MSGVLHHFPSKEALLVGVLECWDALERKALHAVIGTDKLREGAPEVSLGRVCREIIARNVGQREMIRLYSVLQAESLDPDHPAHSYFAERQTRALAGFAQLAPAGSDADAVARRVLALMEGLQLQWLRDPPPDWVQEWQRVTADFPDLRDDA